MMNDHSINVLVIEDNPADARLIEEMLAAFPDVRFQVEDVPRLSDGLERAGQEPFDVILLDLSLPDSRGLETLFTFQSQASHIPIVVLTGMEDKRLGIRALQRGAQDYLVKGQIDSAILARAIRYAIERKQTEQSLKEQADRFRAVTEQALVGIYIVQNDVLTYVNPTMAHLFRYHPDELVDQMSLLDLVDPSDRQKVAESIQLQLRGELDSIRYTFRGVRKNGKTIHCETLERGIDHEGRSAILGTLIDITKHRAAEQALDQSEARLYAVWEVASDAMVLSDPDGTVIGANSAYCDLYGYPQEQVVGENFAIIFPEEARAWANEAYQETFSNPQVPPAFESIVRCRDGEERIVESRIGFILENGQRTAMLSVIRDITERKRAEEALRESELRYRTVADFTYDWEYWIRLDGSLAYISPSCERITGYSCEEFVDNPDLLEGIVHPEDQFFVAEHLHSDLRKDTASNFDYRIVRPDGEVRWINHACRPVYGANGEPLGQRAGNRDITKRKQAERALRTSEQRLRQVIDLVPHPIFAKTAEGQFLLVNQAGAAFAGRTIEEMTGNLESDWVKTPNVLAAILTEDQEVIDSGEAQRFPEARYVDATGKSRVLQVTKIPLYAPEEENPAVLGIALDITELKDAEEELRQRIEALETLRGIGLDLATQLDLDTLLHSIVSQATTLLGGNGGGLLLYQPEEEVIQWAVGVETNSIPTNTKLRRGEGLSGRVWETGKPLIVDDYPQWAGRVSALESRVGRAIAGAPIKWGGEFLGVIDVVADRPGAFTEDDVELLMLLATQAAAAIVNARLFEEIRIAGEELHLLSNRLIDVQETERRRIARELHDEIGQALTVVKINLQSLRQLIDAPGTVAHIDEGIATVDRALEKARNLSLDLRPSILDDLGLIPALRWYLDRQAQRAGFEVEFSIDLTQDRLPPEIEIVCFRIIQEAVTNVMRHAQAEHVRVRLRDDAETLELHIEDDGVGFDAQAARDRRDGGLGLIGMRERVKLADGHISISSPPGVGTEIHVILPWNAN